MSDRLSTARDHRVLLHVEAVGLTPNHQPARRVDDLRLQVVHAAEHLFDLKAGAIHEPLLAVVIHAQLVAALQARAQRHRHIQNAVDVP